MQDGNDSEWETSLCSPGVSPEWDEGCRTNPCFAHWKDRASLMPMSLLPGKIVLLVQPWGSVGSGEISTSPLLAWWHLHLSCLWAAELTVLGAEGLWAWKIKSWWSKVATLSFIAARIQESCKYAGRAGERGESGWEAKAALQRLCQALSIRPHRGERDLMGSLLEVRRSRAASRGCAVRGVSWRVSVPSERGALPDSSICASMGKAEAAPSAPLACIAWKTALWNPSAPQGSVF